MGSGLPLPLLLVALGCFVGATVLLILRRRVVAYFRTRCTSDRPETELHHDLAVGVALMAVAGYVLAVGLTAAVLVPPPALVWVFGFGVPAELVVYLLYTIRFQNAGLHVIFLAGNQ